MPSIHFVAAKLDLSIFPFGVWGLIGDLIVSVPEFIYLLCSMVVPNPGDLLSGYFKKLYKCDL